MRLHGSLIRKLRWNRGWTQEMLAEKAGLSERTITRIEGGESDGGPRTAKKIADALGVEVGAIIHSDEEEEDNAGTAIATG